MAPGCGAHRCPAEMLSGKETGRDEEQRMSRAWMSPDILHPRPRSELAPGCCAADGVMLPMSGCEPCCYGQPKAASALQRRHELQCHDPPALGVTGLGAACPAAGTLLLSQPYSAHPDSCWGSSGLPTAHRLRYLGGETLRSSGCTVTALWPLSLLFRKN